MPKNKVTYCMVVLNRLEEMQKTIREIAPHVTRVCVVDGGSDDGTIEWLDSEECKSLNVDYKVSKQVRLQYGNHTPRERNQYLEMAGHDGWLVYSDSDEMIDVEACKNFDGLINMAEAVDADGICFNSHDIWTYEDGQVYDNVSNYWNPMMWKGYPGQHYAGHTHSHIVRPGAANRWIKSGFQYRHIKTEWRMWLNSTYLYWTTSGVAQNVTTDPVWLGFHELMKKYGHVDWHEFNKEITAGGLPDEIKGWFIDHRNAESPEERSWFIWYFVFLHPEENVDKLDALDKVWNYVEESLLKRVPDGV